MRWLWVSARTLIPRQTLLFLLFPGVGWLQIASESKPWTWRGSLSGKQRQRDQKLSFIKHSLTGNVENLKQFYKREEPAGSRHTDTHRLTLGVGCLLKADVTQKHMKDILDLLCLMGGIPWSGKPIFSVGPSQCFRLTRKCCCGKLGHG